MNLLICMLLLLQSTYSVVPLANAHAHNDYQHPKPLLDALSHGFCSVEADIFLMPGKSLLVGHSKSELKPDRTLQKLYLDPLRQRIQENGNSVYRSQSGKPTGFTLLIDLKTESESTYPVLHELLSQYSDILTEVRNGKVIERAVTVILSGSRPSLNDMARQSPRFAAYDGRLTDLESNVPSHLMPMISDNWTLKIGWGGTGPPPEKVKLQLKLITQQAHLQGRKVRFWAAPERVVVWQLMLDSKVDFINTDRLADLKHFLLSRVK